MPAHVRKQRAAVDQSFDIVGLERDGAFERGKRFISAIQLLQQARTIVIRIRRAWANGDRLAYETLGLLELAALIANDAERVQSLEIRGLALQDLLVNGGSLIELAGAAQTKRVSCKS